MAKKNILFLITLVLQAIIGSGTVRAQSDWDFLEQFRPSDSEVRAQLATAAKTPISSFIQQAIKELHGDIPGYAVSAAGVVTVWADKGGAAAAQEAYTVISSELTNKLVIEKIILPDASDAAGLGVGVVMFAWDQLVFQPVTGVMYKDDYDFYMAYMLSHPNAPFDEPVNAHGSKFHHFAAKFVYDNYNDIKGMVRQKFHLPPDAPVGYTMGVNPGSNPQRLAIDDFIRREMAKQFYLDYKNMRQKMQRELDAFAAGFPGDKLVAIKKKLIELRKELADAEEAVKKLEEMFAELGKERPPVQLLTPPPAEEEKVDRVGPLAEQAAQANREEEERVAAAKKRFAEAKAAIAEEGRRLLDAPFVGPALLQGFLTAMGKELENGSHAAFNATRRTNTWVKTDCTKFYTLFTNHTYQTYVLHPGDTGTEWDAEKRQMVGNNTKRPLSITVRSEDSKTTASEPSFTDEDLSRFLECRFEAMEGFTAEGDTATSGPPPLASKYTCWSEVEWTPCLQFEDIIDDGTLTEMRAELEQVAGQTLQGVLDRRRAAWEEKIEAGRSKIAERLLGGQASNPFLSVDEYFNILAGPELKFPASPGDFVDQVNSILLSLVYDGPGEGIIDRLDSLFAGAGAAAGGFASPEEMNTLIESASAKNQEVAALLGDPAALVGLLGEGKILLESINKLEGAKLTEPPLIKAMEKKLPGITEPAVRHVPGQAYQTFWDNLIIQGSMPIIDPTSRSEGTAASDGQRIAAATDGPTGSLVWTSPNSKTYSYRKTPLATLQEMLTKQKEQAVKKMKETADTLNTLSRQAVMAKSLSSLAPPYAYLASKSRLAAGLMPVGGADDPWQLALALNRTYSGENLPGFMALVHQDFGAGVDGPADPAELDAGLRQDFATLRAISFPGWSNLGMRLGQSRDGGEEAVVTIGWDLRAEREDDGQAVDLANQRSELTFRKNSANQFRLFSLSGSPLFRAAGAGSTLSDREIEERVWTAALQLRTHYENGNHSGFMRGVDASYRSPLATVSNHTRLEDALYDDTYNLKNIRYPQWQNSGFTFYREGDTLYGILSLSWSRRAFVANTIKEWLVTDQLTELTFKQSSAAPDFKLSGMQGSLMFGISNPLSGQMKLEEGTIILENGAKVELTPSNPVVVDLGTMTSRVVRPPVDPLPPPDDTTPPPDDTTPPPDDTTPPPDDTTPPPDDTTPPPDDTTPPPDDPVPPPDDPPPPPPIEPEPPPIEPEPPPVGPSSGSATLVGNTVDGWDFSAATIVASDTGNADIFLANGPYGPEFSNGGSMFLGLGPCSLDDFPETTVGYSPSVSVAPGVCYMVRVHEGNYAKIKVDPGYSPGDPTVTFTYLYPITGM
ncbi:MAG: hypothetical protein ACOY32_10690 [Thermodesulfobacteriota bacterium]